ncbi:MAG: hypothetical protein AAB289_12070, partial [Chloroflexota bacterium]
MPKTALSDPAAPAERGWFDVREVGRVRSVREFVVKVEGLPSCMNGQQVQLSTGDTGMVMGYTQEHVLVLLFGNKAAVRAGDEVYSHGESFSIPVGEGFIGRVISSLGEPLDGQGPIIAQSATPIFREPVGGMERVPVNAPLQTGLRIGAASFAI